MTSADENANTGGRAAPDTETLAQMTPEAIYATSPPGLWPRQAQNLADSEKRAVRRIFWRAPARRSRCRRRQPYDRPLRVESRDQRCGVNDSEWNGWGNGLANTRFQSAQAAGLSADQVPHLKLKWAFGLPAGGDTSGEPSVFGGRVFFGDYNSFAYSLDASTGCVYWSFRADAQIRTAGSSRPSRAKAAPATPFSSATKKPISMPSTRAPARCFGNATLSSACSRTSLPRQFFTRAGFVGLAGSGEIVSSDPHYPCCTYRGSLTALDANTGAVIWKTYTIPDKPKPTKKNALGTQLWAPAGASIWSAPTIDPKLNAIYVGTGNGFTEPAAKTSDSIMALDLKTGKVLWSYQALANDASPGDCVGPGPKDAHCPAKLAPIGTLETRRFCRRSRTASASSSARIRAAKLSRSIPIGAVPFSGPPIFPLAATRPRLSKCKLCGAALRTRTTFTTIRRPAPWRRCASRTEKFCGTFQSPRLPRIPAPAIDRGTRFEAAVTVMPGVVFAGGWDGVLHALSTADGHEFGEFDTAREFTSVNRVAAKGGSLGAPGPVIAAGMLFVGSGYVGTGNGMPGNVLLALAPEKSTRARP